MTRTTAGLAYLVTTLLTLGCFVMSKPTSESAEADTGRKDRETPPAASPISFDASRALRHLEEICKIGPRISGSEGMRKQQELLEKHFKDLGAVVVFQRFRARQVSRRTPVDLANLVVSWHPRRERRVMLCCHYDTRPIADQEEDPRKWTEPFLSANDSGSSVALLMELGRHMKSLDLAVGVDFVFFDAEEYIFNPARVGGDRYFLGSEHFAATYRKKANKVTYQAAVLLDIIGGKNARFPVESHSYFKAGALVEEVWKVAGDLRCRAFVKELGSAVEDDHLALNRVGIPAIDIIDFSYPHWHRLSDVPANCSGESLEQVARVLVEWLQRRK
jgi:hypothetical protein